jgi:hypothetical protein
MTPARTLSALTLALTLSLVSVHAQVAPGSTLPAGCAAILCPVGTECMLENGKAACVPLPCACPKIFTPVCCLGASGVQKTAANECECSKCGSGKVIRTGPCPKPILCMCAASYAPVCCKVVGKPAFTAENKCSCDCDGAVLAEGECGEPVDPAPTRAPPVLVS